MPAKGFHRIFIIATSLMVGLVTNASAQTYNLTDLGALTGSTNSRACAINASNQVVGYFLTSTGAQAFLYTSTNLYNLGTLGGTNQYAVSINDAGDIVGTAETTNGFRAFLFSSNQWYDLSAWGGSNSAAQAINAQQAIVGYGAIPGQTYAVRFLTNTAYALGTFGGTNSYAAAINASNVVVGAAEDTNGTRRAFQFDTILQDLNALATNNSLFLSDARGINNVGAITGWGQSNSTAYAFLYLPSGQVITLDHLSGGTNAYALSLNHSNAVVGASSSTNGLVATYWTNANPTDLNAHIATNSGWILREASSINDAGAIVGWGNLNDEAHAFLLTPNQPPTVAITHPTNNAAFASPLDLSITIAAIDDVAVTKVELYAGTKLLTTLTERPYVFTWPDVSAGSYTFKAVAYDNLGLSATSSVVNAITLPALSSLKCWLRPESLNLTNGNPVSSWTDSSGSGNPGTSSGSSRPTYLTNQLNGWPGVKFDGADDYLALNMFMSAATAGEMFVVFKSDTNGSRPLWQFNSDGTWGSTSQINEKFGRNPAATLWGNFASFKLMNVEASSSVWNARFNGNLVYSDTPNLGFNTSYPAIGRIVYFGNYYGPLTLVEFIVYRTTLTPMQRMAVNKYLISKYQLVATNLPPQPTLVANTLATNGVSLSWSPFSVSDWMGSRLERRTAYSDFTEIARTSNDYGYFDTNVVQGGTYTYRVRFCNFNGTSPYSEVVTVTVPSTANLSFPLTNLTLWLRPDIGCIMSTRWMDQSGKNNSVAWSGGYFITNGLNGKPTIRFNNNMTLTIPGATIQGGQAEIFVVQRVPSATPASAKGYSTFGTYSSYFPDPYGNIQDTFASTRGENNTFKPSITITNWHVYNAHSKSNDWAAYINGLRQYSTSASTFYSPTTFTFGYGNRYGSSYWDGYVAEIMIFNKVLSVIEREAVGRYLNSRFQIVTNTIGATTGLACQSTNAAQINVSWKPNTNATFYQLARQIGSNAFATIAIVDPFVTNFVDSIQSSEAITYRLLACNYGFTNTVDFQTPLATISNPQPEDSKYVGSPITLTVQPTGGLSPTNFTPIVTDSAFNTLGSGYITVSNSTSGDFANRNPFTIECRVNPPSYPNNAWRAIVSKYDAEYYGYKSFMLALETNGTPFGFRTGGRVQSPIAIPTNSWSHIALTYNGTNCLLYVNGTLMTNVTYTGANPFSTVPFMIGAANFSGTAYNIGNMLIDEVRIWNKALSGTSVSNWANVVLSTNHPDYSSLLFYTSLNAPASNLGVSGGSFTPIASYNPYHVDLLVNDSLQQRWTNSPYETSILSILPQRASLMTYVMDGYGNSRYSAPQYLNFVFAPVMEAALDSDGDGISDAIELLIGTNPYSQDSDGDGLPDWWEIKYGLNPLSGTGRDGADGDFDNDGVSNMQEYLNGTNPADGQTGDNSTIQLRVYRPN